MDGLTGGFSVFKEPAEHGKPCKMHFALAHVTLVIQVTYRLPMMFDTDGMVCKETRLYKTYFFRCAAHYLPSGVA